MKFGYTIIYVASVPDTLAFYQAAFGFSTRFLHESGDYGELETGSTALAFASHAMGNSHFGSAWNKLDARSPPPGIELAFVTPDVAAAYAKAIAAGATALNPPEQKPWGQTVAYVRAKEGTLLELCSPMGG
jgi:lactoylglutathione lyase